LRHLLPGRAFRVKPSRQQKLLRRKRRRIEQRLRERAWSPQERPMFRATNVRYDLSDRARGLDVGGVALMLQVARRVGLIRDIDRRLHLLKVHLPYHESDHVLNVAFNILAGGIRLEDIELRRQNEVFLDALGTQRIPDPTTEGDFCRRFIVEDVETLMSVINDARLRVWQQQSSSFFEHAHIDADGTVVETAAECKQGIDLSYKGVWGYHPLVVSLAETSEPLFLVNRSGNRPSHEGATERFDQAIVLCRRAGFRHITLRGDTDFSQTGHLDRWDEDGVRFIFGMDASPRLQEIANALPKAAWNRLSRPARYEVKTQRRQKPERIKEAIVVGREFENTRLCSEDVAEFDYSPVACKKTYRIVVVRKNLSVAKGERMLFDDIRYFFYITNDRPGSSSEIVFEANDRCNQENLIAQLQGGVHAMNMPVDNLVSNWAYMVMASLAWTLKAWFSLLLPEEGRWAEKYRAEKQSVLRMEFRKFVNVFMRMPAQVVRTGRRVWLRLLAWNPWQAVFLRVVDQVRSPLRC
jgi:hypothetical protein